MPKKKIYIPLLSAVLVIALVFGGGALYVSDGYSADLAQIMAFAADFAVTETEYDSFITYGDENADTAFIFYPGGKVEHTAYAPLMTALAQKGMFCILVQMPCDLAVLDINAAKEIRERFPAISNWYIGGYSLGGSMAASHLQKHTADYCGLILLGSYSTADLSDTDLRICSVYGSADEVLNREKYQKYLPNLGEGLTEQVIDGGCHAYFGMYGMQKGDGMPTLSAKEQILLTADILDAFVKEAY